MVNMQPRVNSGKIFENTHSYKNTDIKIQFQREDGMDYALLLHTTGREWNGRER